MKLSAPFANSEKWCLSKEVEFHTTAVWLRRDSACSYVFTPGLQLLGYGEWDGRGLRRGIEKKKSVGSWLGWDGSAAAAGDWWKSNMAKNKDSGDGKKSSLAARPISTESGVVDLWLRQLLFKYLHRRHLAAC